jgi:two-component system, OmpR family, phosphate regulon sensor histidine kinase PhoR
LLLRGAIERHLDGAVTVLETSGDTVDRRDTLVVLQDLSERDALARTRVEFVANASHELRTPLASLSGFIETLSGPAKNDPVARERFLGIMAEQAARMSRLIDDLLLLSRVEMRAHVAPTAVVDLNAVVADAMKPLARAAQTANKTLSIVPSPVAIRVLGEHDELIQAVQNLVQNALKYGRPGGTVTVHVSETANGPSRTPRAVISIADDGPGISAEHLPRLTERFYRVSTAASRNTGGTGLGLAIVKHIAARHRGKLDIASEVGKGSTFTISLPASHGAQGGKAAT